MLVLPAITHTETTELTNSSIVRFLKVVAEKTIEVFRREKKKTATLIGRIFRRAIIFLESQKS